MKKLISGKVRDVFEVDEKSLAIVTTDRISAFDVILGSTIPGKGIALNLLSNFWFSYTKDIIPNHLLSTSLNDMPSCFSENAAQYQDRTVLVKKLKMLPYEFIVRGYLFGNMWEAYKNGVPFCGNKLEGNYEQAERLEAPIITPSKKASEGHDEYISFEQLASDIGEDLAKTICQISLQLYKRCYEYAEKRGIIIADTKFEFGYDESGVLTLGDEIFTPDSSRFWDKSAYHVGESPKSFDKQFVRDWLIQEHLNRKEPGPQLPNDIITKTSQLYKDCLDKLLPKSK